MVRGSQLEWFEQLPCSVTVCDKEYTILYMNSKAAEANSNNRDKSLIGRSLMDCHPLKAQRRLRKVMASGKPNVYTTEKKGSKKMVYQCHWKKGGRIGGLVELTFELPSDVPNLVRT